MPASVLIEMGEVVRATPGPGALPVEIAGWYRRKALLLEHVAAQGGPEQASLVEAARRARQHVAELDRRCGDGAVDDGVQARARVVRHRHTRRK